MTREKLEKIYYLKKEIEMWNNELVEIEATGTESQPITSATIKKQIEHKHKECVEAVKEVLDYMDTLSDCVLRQIIYYRCIKCMTWNEVAARIGGGNSADGLRMQFSRALIKEK